MKTRYKFILNNKRKDVYDEKIIEHNSCNCYDS